MNKDFNKVQEKNESQQKSKPMMNLIARTPSVVSSSTSLSPEKRYYGKQDPWRSVVADDRSGQPDKPSSAGYSKLDYDRAWSSQEWKSEVTAHDRSGQPDKTSWSMAQQVRPHHGETLLDFVIDQGNLIKSTSKRWQIPKISTWEVMQQNL